MIRKKSEIVFCYFYDQKSNQKKSEQQFLYKKTQNNLRKKNKIPRLCTNITYGELFGGADFKNFIIFQKDAFFGCFQRIFNCGRMH